tara:strand:- start:201 stop:1154 length:954 start_codon:yes stop_codon:yes gene_type:complete
MMSGAVAVIVAQGGVWGQLSQVPVSILVAPLGMFFLTWILNALRARIFFLGKARGFTQCRAMATILTCDLAAKTTPGGSGVPVMAVVIMKKFGVNAGMALSGFIVISFVDATLMVSMVALLLISGVDDLFATSWKDQATLYWAVFIVLLLVIGLSVRFYNQGLHLLVACINRVLVDKPGRYYTLRQLVWFRRGLRDFLRFPVGRRCAFLIVTLIFWSVQLSILHASLMVLGGHVDWFHSAAIQVISMAAGRLLFLPGGVIGTEGAAIALLSISMAPATATIAVLIWRSATLLTGLIVGGLSSVYFAIHLGRQFPDKA